MTSIKERITTYLLIIVGLISVAISIVDIFVKDFETLPVLRNTSQITLLIVGLIGFSLGLERRATFESISQKLNELGRKLESNASAQILDGYDNIYDSLIELINGANETIRATAFGKGQTTVSQKYLDALGKRLKESRACRQKVEYRLVLGYETPEDREARLQPRRQTFESAGVSDQVQYRYIKMPWTLDLAIIDDKHLIIAFPTLPTDKALRKAIKFVDKPDLVSSVCRWYDEYLWNNAEKT